MLIEIAGIDGSGKTTLINRLRRQINGESLQWAYERNFKNRGKRLLEQIALSKGFDRCEEVFDPNHVEFANALEMVEEVHRHFYYLREDSRLAYFVDQYQTSWLATAKLSQLTVYDHLKDIYTYLPRPDLSVLLVLPPQAALERLNSREKGDQILQMKSPIEYLTRLEGAFEQVNMELPYPQVKLDALQSADEIFEQVLERIQACKRA